MLVSRGLVGKGADGRTRRGEGTYHRSWYSHALKLFLVVCSGFGAIVCDEDESFACWNALDRCSSPYTVADSLRTHLYSVASPTSRQSLRKGCLRTIAHLFFLSPKLLFRMMRCPQMGRDGKEVIVILEGLGAPTIAVKQEYLDAISICSPQIETALHK